MSATPDEIARRALAEHLAAISAAELLSRYAKRRDPEAFAGLVQQFGPMVLGVCRRVLGSSPDAEDAFQAVFLSLERQANSFRDADALPAWLHRVALRTARKALVRRTANPAPAEVPEPVDPADPFADVAWKDVRRVLDEELDALPERVRGPVVLCCLDGLTQDEAAARLGLSLNTVKRRLGDGRELLRARLTRRGLAPLLAAAAVSDPTGLRSAVPDSLALLAVEMGVGGGVSLGVEALTVVAPAAALTRRVALAGLLGAGAAAGGLVYALSPPRRPPELPVLKRPVQEVAVGPHPSPKPGPLQFEPLGKPLLPADHVTSLVFSRDGQTLISGGEGALQLWDVATGEMRADYVKLARDKPDADGNKQIVEIGAVLLSPDGKSLITACPNPSDLKVKTFDLATGKMKSIERDNYGLVADIAISPDGKSFAMSESLGLRAAISLFEVTPYWSPLESNRDPQIKRDWRGDWPKQKPRVVIKSPDDTPADCVAFSPDGATLASIYRWKTIRLYDVKTGREKAAVFNSPSGDVTRLAFSPNGRFLASCAAGLGDGATGGGTLQVVDLDTGTNHLLATHWGKDERGGGFWSLVFHPDGKSLVVGGWQEITWWDVKTGEKQGTVKTSGGPVKCLAFSPDGSILASTTEFLKPEEQTYARFMRLWRVSRKK